MVFVTQESKRLSCAVTTQGAPELQNVDQGCSHLTA